jgi:hypothetical protein
MITTFEVKQIDNRVTPWAVYCLTSVADKQYSTAICFCYDATNAQLICDLLNEDAQQVAERMR